MRPPGLDCQYRLGERRGALQYCNPRPALGRKAEAHYMGLADGSGELS